MKFLTDRRTMAELANDGARITSRIYEVEDKTDDTRKRGDTDRDRIATLEAALVMIEARVAALERA